MEAWIGVGSIPSSDRAKSTIELVCRRLLRPIAASVTAGQLRLSITSGLVTPSGGDIAYQLGSGQRTQAQGVARGRELSLQSEHKGHALTRSASAVDRTAAEPVEVVIQHPQPGQLPASALDQEPISRRQIVAAGRDRLLDLGDAWRRIERHDYRALGSMP
jgi:hypothetical protein